MQKLHLGIATSILILLSAPACAQHFNNAIFFGDSNTDSGRYLYIAPGSGLAPPGTGTYTTNPDPGWAASLSSRFGITVTPSDAPGGGNNYAAGGARVTTGNAVAWSATAQVAAYLTSTGGVADPNALYTMYIGINDLKSGSVPDILGNNPALVALGQQTASLVSTLSAAGARYILVPDATSTLTPQAGVASGFGYSATAANSRALYSQTVWNTLAAEGVNFIPADFNAVYNYALLNPGQFGILYTSVLQAACGATNAYQCGPSNYAPNANNTSFFADSTTAPDGGGHLAGVMQKVEADYYYSLITAPSMISFLAENAIKTRERSVMAIQNQIELSQRGRGPSGVNAWASGDLGLNSMDNYPGFPSDPNHAVALSAGVDYRVAPGMIAGVSLSTGTMTSGFGGGFGSFTQDEVSGNLYGAVAAGPIWANAILGYGRLDYSVNRIVPLGISQQFNSGSTTGGNWSGALQGGYKFVQGDLTHGPVVGVLAQRVTVGGFTESGSVTSLGFGNQSRDSFVTMLGYRASYRLGPFQPFVQATWDHEFANTNRLITASLTTIAAPSYTMPAVLLGKDWGTATVGTTYDLGPGVVLTGSVSADVAQSSATTYTGEAGVNFKF